MTCLHRKHLQPPVVFAPLSLAHELVCMLGAVYPLVITQAPARQPRKGKGVVIRDGRMDGLDDPEEGRERERSTILKASSIEQGRLEMARIIIFPGSQFVMQSTDNAVDEYPFMR